MAGTYAPDPDLHVVDQNNQPVSGGLVWTYIAGTSTPVATYADVALSTPNTNPIVAGTDGRFTAFLAPGNSYKFIYETAPSPPATHGVVLATRDNIGAIPISSPTTDVVGTAGELLAAGNVVYLSSGLGSKTAGQWYLADADFDYASSLATTVGIAVNPTQAGTQGLFRTSGQIAIPGATLTPGSLYYISATAGGVTTPAPANIRLLGQALDVSTLAVGMPGTSAATANLFEKGRTAPVGHWIDAGPANVAIGGPGAGNWNSGTVNTWVYALIGRTMKVTWYSTGGQWYNTANQINIQLPAGATAQHYHSGIAYVQSTGMPYEICFAYIGPSQQWITIHRNTLANFAANTGVTVFMSLDVDI